MRPSIIDCKKQSTASLGTDLRMMLLQQSGIASSNNNNNSNNNNANASSRTASLSGMSILLLPVTAGGGVDVSGSGTGGGNATGGAGGLLPNGNAGAGFQDGGSAYYNVDCAVLCLCAIGDCLATLGAATADTVWAGTLQNNFGSLRRFFHDEFQTTKALNAISAFAGLCALVAGFLKMRVRSVSNRKMCHFIFISMLIASFLSSLISVALWADLIAHGRVRLRLAKWLRKRYHFRAASVPAVSDSINHHLAVPKISHSSDGSGSFIGNNYNNRSDVRNSNHNNHNNNNNNNNNSNNSRSTNFTDTTNSHVIRLRRHKTNNFPVYIRRQSTPIYDKETFGWAYWVMVAASVFQFLANVCHLIRRDCRQQSLLEEDSRSDDDSTALKNDCNTATGTKSATERSGSSIGGNFSFSPTTLPSSISKFHRKY